MKHVQQPRDVLVSEQALELSIVLCEESLLEAEPRNVLILSKVPLPEGVSDSLGAPRPASSQHTHEYGLSSCSQYALIYCDPLINFYLVSCQHESLQDHPLAGDSDREPYHRLLAGTTHSLDKQEVAHTWIGYGVGRCCGCECALLCSLRHWTAETRQQWFHLLAPSELVPRTVS